MKRRLTLALAAAALAGAGLTGCAGPAPADYAAEKPVLDLKTYFNGPIEAHGIFTDRSGKVVRRFTVQMTGTWTGNQGVLDERFTYSDGKTERRIWRLTDEGGGRWSGRADDVIGVAEGVAAGIALPLLGAFGYTPGSRDAAALQALSNAYCLLPCLLKLAAGVLLWALWIRKEEDR